MNENTILIIDDDRDLSEWLGRALVAQGASVSTARDGAEGLRQFFGLRPDLVLMERRLPKRASMDVLREIRLLTNVPVLMVSGDDGIPEVVRYLDAGADDFVPKPYDQRVLMARIRALLRRTRWRRNRQNGHIYDDGHLVINLPAFSVTVGGEAVKLSATEIGLLAHLTRRAGQTCTYAEILADVWGDRFTNNPEYVHAYIWQLRHKLEKSPKKPDYLFSVRGVGYRFVAGTLPAARPRPLGPSAAAQPAVQELDARV